MNSQKWNWGKGFNDFPISQWKLPLYKSIASIISSPLFKVAPETQSHVWWGPAGWLFWSLKNILHNHYHMMDCLAHYNNQMMIHDHIIKLFVRKSLSLHFKLIMTYGTFSISLLDHGTSQSVIRPRGDGQAGLSGRRHSLSHHHLDCEWSSHLRWAAAPTATHTSVFWYW